MFSVVIRAYLTLGLIVARKQRGKGNSLNWSSQLLGLRICVSGLFFAGFSYARSGGCRLLALRDLASRTHGRNAPKSGHTRTDANDPKRPK